MPLHRDIYWVGRQWAVTGYGMQAIDQRLNGIFDIEVSRLWEDSLAEGPVAELVEIGVGVVSGVMNLESSGVEASDWRLRHEAAYHEA